MGSECCVCTTVRHNCGTDHDAVMKVQYYPTLTPDQFHAIKKCVACGTNQFLASKMQPVTLHYARTWPFRYDESVDIDDIVWRIKCDKKYCHTAVGIILKNTK